MSLLVNLFRFTFMKYHIVLRKNHKKQYYFTYTFLSCLDILILKNLFQLVILIKILKIVLVLY